MLNRPLDLTMVLHIRFLEVEGKKRFILDAGVQDSKCDKISVYTQDGFLILSVIDHIGLEQTVKATASDLVIGFNTLLFELKKDLNNSILAIYCNNRIIASTEVPYPIIFNNNPIEENYFVGSDVAGKNNGEFEVSEQIIFAKTLNVKEKSEIDEYLRKKHSPQPKGAIRFTNGAFLYRDKVHKGLIQNNIMSRPKYLSNE